ncbi:hypothetical protein [Actinoplanes sp. TFC3]|uniref:hypothetical protein n=1 Tax=Actinoplanes sp. TFC3 TaxID=1710355 RepID=UPI000AB51C84|nr:hypothetical protein [Actinoplanes sp. TFC3]
MMGQPSGISQRTTLCGAGALICQASLVSSAAEAGNGVNAADYLNLYLHRWRS